MTKAPMLSIVAPCYGGESCLAERHDRPVAAAHMAVSNDYEVILVNDGSSARSWSMMLDLTKTDKRLRLLGHRQA